jgi:predicted RNA-binding protein Jag
MNGDPVGGEAQADMSESKRRFFSGDTLQQALVQAANHFHLQPEEVAFQPVEKRHGFIKVRRKVLIEVDPEAPKRAAGSTAGAEVAPSAGQPSRTAASLAPDPSATTASAEPAVAAIPAVAPLSVTQVTPLRGEGLPGSGRGVGRGEGQGGSRHGEDQGRFRGQGNEGHPDSRRGFGRDRSGPRRPSGAYPRDRRPVFAAEGSADAGPEDLVALPEKPRNVSERYPQADGPQAEAAAKGVALLLRVAGLDLTPRIYRGEERLEIDLVGGDTDWCFADDGELLMALEHLLPRIIRSISGEAVLCRVDCDNFHEIREERLRSLAQKVADEVRQKGRPRTLVPMNPADRRIIHVTLADDPAVVTESEGDGYFKRITVRPA